MSLSFTEVVNKRVDMQAPPGVVFAKVEHEHVEYFSFGCNSLDKLSSPESDTIFEIGSTTYAVLGHLVEEITGERWDELVTKHICTPLQLDSTRTVTSARPENVATGHHGKEPVPHFSLGILGVGGALKSSARDMATFLSANLGFIESELASAMKKARTVIYRESPIFALGLGWHLQQRGSREIVWH
ncbi:MAG: beta-lactamase family protein [Pseudomonadaceae bacterium]|nr:beta-lactamase family protein [Pseudomonadaceae bacterium]